MKKLFEEGKYTAYGRREGATYTVEIRAEDGTPVAWKWFDDETKNGETKVPTKFHDMIQKAVYRV